MIFRAEMRRIASRDSESDGGPPSPGSYILPLLVIVVLCAGYVWYSRRKRRDASFELRDVLKYRPPGMGNPDGVRLSIDDMPSRAEFLTNNASTDSLPDNVELPVFSRPPTHTAWQGTSSGGRGHPSYNSASPSGAFTPFMDDPTPAQGKAGRILGLGGGMKSAGGGFGRRSMRNKGPVEADSSSEGDESDEGGARGGDGGGAAVFGIGDEDEEERL